MRVIDIVLVGLMVGAAAGLLPQGSVAGRLLPTPSAGSPGYAEAQPASRWCERLLWLRPPAVHSARPAH